MRSILLAAMAAAVVVSCGGGSDFANLIGRCIGKSAGDGLTFSRPYDEGGAFATRRATDAGTRLSVFARHQGGELQVVFEGPVATGALPRSSTDCTWNDQIWFYDGVATSSGRGSVTVVDGGQPADALVALEVGDVALSLPDGGKRELPPRAIVTMIR